VTRKRRQTVPLTQFRLPAKTRKLPDIPFADGWEDEPTLPSHFSSSTAGYRAAHTAPETPTREHVSGLRTPIPAAYTPMPWNRAQRGAARRSKRGRQYDAGRQTGGLQPAQIRVGLAIASCLLVLLVAWIAVSASGIGLTLRAHPTPTAVVQATAQPTPTTQPSPTATTTPKPTATTDPQRHLNALAAADFRAVTLATFNDGSCSAGNSRTHFSSGQLIYANICTSGSASSTRMTVTIRQGGRVVRTMASNFAFAPGAHYYFYTTSGNLGSGSFELVVTATVEGQQGVARDIRFTIG
jgi:hypothetical protein